MRLAVHAVVGACGGRCGACGAGQEALLLVGWLGNTTGEGVWHICAATSCRLGAWPDPVQPPAAQQAGTPVEVCAPASGAPPSATCRALSKPRRSRCQAGHLDSRCYRVSHGHCCCRGGCCPCAAALPPQSSSQSLLSLHCRGPCSSHAQGAGEPYIPTISTGAALNRT